VRLTQNNPFVILDTRLTITGRPNGIQKGVKGAFSQKPPSTQPKVIGPGQDARYD